MKKKTFNPGSKVEFYAITGKELQELCKPIYSEIIAEYLDMNEHYPVLTDISSCGLKATFEIIVVGLNDEGYMILTVNNKRQILKL